MSVASRRVAKREAQLQADLKFLSSRGVQIVTTSTKQQVITRDSIHAIANLLRAIAAPSSTVDCIWPRCQCDEQQACPPGIRELAKQSSGDKT